MNTVRLFRVQDSSGRGPFRPGFVDLWLDDRDFSQVESIPWPKIQALAREIRHCGFGCRSLDQLRLWFTRSEMQKLRCCGYRAVAMEGTVILDTPTQTLFHRDRPLYKDAEEIILHP